MSEVTYTCTRCGQTVTEDWPGFETWEAVTQTHLLTHTECPICDLQTAALDYLAAHENLLALPQRQADVAALVATQQPPVLKGILAEELTKFRDALWSETRRDMAIQWLVGAARRLRAMSPPALALMTQRLAPNTEEWPHFLAHWPGMDNLDRATLALLDNPATTWDAIPPVIARRPYEDDKPDNGILESDYDFVKNNMEAAVVLLEIFLALQTFLRPTLARHFLGAYRKGYTAATATALRCNPYAAKAYRRYWDEGYDDAVAGQPERYRAVDNG